MELRLVYPQNDGSFLKITSWTFSSSKCNMTRIVSTLFSPGCQLIFVDVLSENLPERFIKKNKHETSCFLLKTHSSLVSVTHGFSDFSLLSPDLDVIAAIPFGCYIVFKTEHLIYFNFSKRYHILICT